MPKTTYLLGAGASANALPTYANFRERFGDFKKAADAYSRDTENVSKSSDLESRFNGFLKEIRKIHTDLSFHRSPDTLAKKYFHKDDKVSLRNLKAILVCYFMYEQALIVKRERRKTTHGDFEDVVSPKDAIDKRYDAFLASILLPKVGFQIAPNFKILSWNYDFQLELCFHHYSNINWTYVQQVLKSIPYFNADNSLAGSANPLIIHLNGLAIQYRDNKETIWNTVLLPGDFVPETFPFKELVYIFECLKVPDKSIKNEIDKFFFFGWEHLNGEGRPNEEFFIYKRAMEVAKETEILVVIGYSFPSFNNPVDRMLLNNMTNLKKIIIQSHTPEVIADNLTALFDETKDWKRLYGDKIKFVDPGNGFYIPSNEKLDGNILSNRVYHLI